MEVQSMDKYAIDPVGCIHRFAIWNGEPARFAMPRNREPASQHQTPFTATGSTVYVHQFHYDVEDDERGSSSMPGSTVNEEFAPDSGGSDGSDSEDEPFTAFSSAPVAFKWVSEARLVVAQNTNMEVCYSLRLLQDGVDRAYALPWWDECVIWMQLGDRCPLFFTDTMNGCALAFGGDPRTPVVAHSNGGHGGPVAALEQLSVVQKAFPNIQNWEIYGKDQYISDSERESRQITDYDPEGTQANVIGRYVGPNHGWEFWVQRWMRYRPKLGGKYLITDFKVDKIYPR